MAPKYGLLKRITGQENRRIWFIEQERLLSVLNESWKLRKLKTINRPYKSIHFRIEPKTPKCTHKYTKNGL